MVVLPSDLTLAILFVLQVSPRRYGASMRRLDLLIVVEEAAAKSKAQCKFKMFKSE